MKSAVAITLILGGIFVVALPPLSDAWLNYTLTHGVWSQTGATNITLTSMADPYRFGCWLIGVVMILVAVVASVLPSMLQSRISAPPSDPSKSLEG